MSVLKKLFNQKNRLFLKNLDIKILNENKIIMKLANIKFKNFGYNKNLITGKIFEKDFKINFYTNLKDINFKIKNSGVNIDIKFDDNLKNDIKRGTFKSKILGTNLKSNFEFNDKEIKIKNFYLRNKSLAFSNESLIIFKPFFDMNLKFVLEELNLNIFKKINFNEVQNFKEIIKKINSKSEIYFEPKKFSKNLVEQLNLKIVLTYGMINYSKKLLISGDIFECKGNINLLTEYPLLYFDCKIISNNKKNLLKKLNIKIKDEKEDFKLIFKGNLNILNKKIYFKKISVNKNYDASREDLDYFKNNFEKILLNEDFFDIFSLKKIKKFFLEIK